MLRSITFAIVLTVIVAGVARADTTPNPMDTAAELSALRSRIAQLESRQSENWLNERRAEEVKLLVQEVLADADTRASLLAEGATAGHDNGHFWIGSADGTFLLRISGLIQVRHVYNSRNGDRSNIINANQSASFDQNEAGFSIPRAKIEFSGHISSPRLMYALRLSVDESTNDVWADKIVISYCVAENLWISAGEDKAPFLREELVEAQHQLAVERSLVNELFTTGRVQGIWANWHASDTLHVALAITDGALSGERKDDVGIAPLAGAGFTSVSKDFNDDDSDFALTARVDWLLAGNWEQMEDFTGWSGEATSVALGAAVHWEVRETGDDIGAANTGTGHTRDTLQWTVDASFESEGFNFYVAYVGADFDYESDVTIPPADAFEDMNPWGVVVQGGYHVIPDKFEVFLRWEHIDLDTGDVVAGGPANAISDDEIDILTFGGNWYLNRHQSKLTVDLVWVMDPLPANLGSGGTVVPADYSSLGLLGDSDDAEDQLALRTQFTLTF